MDAVIDQAPSVVAVVVVSHPAVGFDEVLEALAVQDYPNLKTLFLIAGEPGEFATRIHDRLPDAFVRSVEGNPGYGAAANEVLRLVEGINGFFLLMHDDVALEPDAVRVLVEELYRSNAGIVGPKLVDWDRPHVLQHVGLGVDRFGEIDALVEPGEVDQEQHDSVRDVFCLPSACLLVRADLFHSLGGFEASYSFYGDDLDLCWRAHLSGARVVVVPEAKARHRERLPERRPDLHHRSLAAQHRIRTVATLTGGVRVGLVLIELLLITLVEMVVGVFTGHFAEAFTSLRSLFGVIPHAVSISRRRAAVAGLRQVPYREVAGLQIRGSARFSAYLRTREQRSMTVDHSSVGTNRFTKNTAGQLAAWCAIAAIALLGSRNIIGRGVPTVGEFLPYPASPRQMLGDYWSGWWGHGLGATKAVPTGVALIGSAGVATFGHMGLLHTVAILGWLPVGYIGAWRLVSFFPSSRARILGLLVYAAIPVPYDALGSGKWSVLATYGLMPWILDLLRRFAGIEPSLTARADEGVVDSYISVTLRQRLRMGAKLVLISAIMMAFAPASALSVLFVAVVVAVAGLMAHSSTSSALLVGAAGVLSVVGGFILNLPYQLGFGSTAGWDTVVGAPLSGVDGTPLIELMRLGSPVGAGNAAIALWLPALAAPLLARGWRLTWAARGSVLAVAGFALAVCADHQLLPLRLPSVEFFFIPAGVGLCVTAAVVTAAFEQDVQGGDFGWKQPLGVLCGIAIFVGLFPAVTAAGSGRWSAPTLTTQELLQSLAADPIEGDSHTIFLGDPRVLPVPGWRFDIAGASGMSFMIVDDGTLSAVEHWAGEPSAAEDDVRDTLGLIANNSTARGGRLLAPYGIRYVIVPRYDGVNSYLNHELPLPEGLTDSLDSQLDFRLVYSPPNYQVYENVAWLPTRSMLSASAAAASTQAGAEALVRAEFEPSAPVFVGARDRGPAYGAVTAGLLHVATAIDSRWTVKVDSQTLEPQSAFGGTTVFNVPTGGVASLQYATAGSRHITVLLQAFGWLACLLLASNIEIAALRRRRTIRPELAEPILSFDPLIDELPSDAPVMPNQAGEQQ